MKKGEKKESKPQTQSNIMDELSKKQIFKKFSYRGKDLGTLINLSIDEISQLLRARQRRRLRRKLHQKYGKFLEKLINIKKTTPQGEKPKAVKTH
jgi:small subunit ribosomal protein S15e